MINSRDESGLRTLIEDAVKANARRHDGAVALLKGFQTVESWVTKRSTTVEYYYEAHNKVAEALSVMLAAPGGPLPPVLDILTSDELESRYPELDLPTAIQSHATITVNFVVAQWVARRLLKRPVEVRHRQLYESALRTVGSEEPNEQRQAIELMLAVAFGDYALVTERFEKSLRLDLATYENSHRTLIKLAYLLAQCATGSADADAAFGAGALGILTQFNYYLWIVRQDLTAQIDIVSMVFASQLLQMICGTLPADTEAFFEALAPAVVASEMQRIVSGTDQL